MREHPAGLRDQPIETIKGLYPVVFYGRGGAMLEHRPVRLGDRLASAIHTRWPGRRIPLARRRRLGERAGMGIVPRRVRLLRRQRPKAPGARVYARFSDPSTAIESQLPIYLVNTSTARGESSSRPAARCGACDRSMRPTSIGTTRNSSAGLPRAACCEIPRAASCWLTKNVCLLGDHIAVRAILTDAQFLPLTADEVTATLVDPDGAPFDPGSAANQAAPREGM